MHTEHHSWYSPHIGRAMDLNVYGHWGRPILVFPAQGGRYFEFADFGMVDATRDLLEAGQVKIFTVDSLDNESWANSSIPPDARARRHEDYDRYITQEVVPFIRAHCADSAVRPITAGVSMGGYHAANFLFRHPQLFGGCISMSGLLQLGLFVGDYVDDNVYYNSPLRYLPGLDDPAYLDLYRQSSIIMCAGQGAWEEPMLADARALAAILESKGVPAWIDIWGHDVNHDWPWWSRQLPYFLQHL